jgi:hypothetical protein
MPIAAVLPFLTELFRLVNNLLEGTDVGQRQASSLAWFLVTWPALKTILALSKVSPEDLDRIEAMAKGGGVHSA